MAVDCGIKPGEFWEYSLEEVRDLMESYARKERRRMKEEISSRFELADLLGIHMQKLFDDKNEITLPHVWDAYPELFADERRMFEERQKAVELERARESRREYAERYNEMRRQRGLS